MKPLHATCVIDIYNEITQTPSVVINGWKAAGIIEAVTQGSSRIPAIGPFFEIDNRNFYVDMDNSQIISINEELRVLEINSRDEKDGDGDLEGDSDWEERE